MFAHEGYTVGDRIRAYDFKPMSDRPDCYIEGVITAVDSEGADQGFAAYVVDVTLDTLYEEGGRTQVYVPLEVSIFEYNERIQKL